MLKFTANLGQLHNHVTISKSLKDAGFSAAVPILTIGNEEYISDGELYAYLTYPIQGKQINSSEVYAVDYEKKARVIGKIIGQLDLVLSQFDTPVNDANLLLTMKDWALPKVRQ